MAIEPAKILLDPNSKDSDIINFLQSRLKKGESKFTEQQIKITYLWFDFREQEEVEAKNKNKDCEWTRKVTIERKTISEIAEDILAFSGSLFDSITELDTFKKRYNFDEMQKMRIKNAFQALFTENAFGKNEIQYVNKAYISCKKIEFWGSLENENRFAGPVVTDSSSIQYSCKGGNLTAKAVKWGITIFSICVSIKKNCTII